MNYFKKKEEEDLKKLEMALLFLKNENFNLKQRLDLKDKDIKARNGINDDRNNIIINIY